MNWALSRGPAAVCPLFLSFNVLIALPVYSEDPLKTRALHQLEPYQYWDGDSDSKEINDCVLPPDSTFYLVCAQTLEFWFSLLLKFL